MQLSVKGVAVALGYPRPHNHSSSDSYAGGTSLTILNRQRPANVAVGSRLDRRIALQHKF